MWNEIKGTIFLETVLLLWVIQHQEAPGFWDAFGGLCLGEKRRE